MEKTLIAFDNTKDEFFKVNNYLKDLCFDLEHKYIVLNGKNITHDALANIQLLVLAGPRNSFAQSEFEAIKSHVDSGRSLLVMLTEGGEMTFQTNINTLLEEYGIMINNDCVIRNHYSKYLHPKECVIAGSVVNSGIIKYLEERHLTPNSKECQFVYPYGASLNVGKPALPILSTGCAAFPPNRPICAFYARNYQDGRVGKVAVIGSGHILSNGYLAFKENSLMKDIIFTFLLSEEIEINHLAVDDAELSEYTMVPESTYLAERLRNCFEESLTDVTSSITDVMDLLEQNLYSLNLRAVCDTRKVYENLSLDHEPLRLIPPQFNQPLPPLNPAVFPPTFSDGCGSTLELFDLDEIFGSQKTRLDQLTTECVVESGQENAQFYIRQAASIANVDNFEQNEKSVLHAVASAIFDYKRNTFEK